MQELNLPSYDFRIRREGEQLQIFDEIRKKYVVLSPEEWVRQHFVRFLVEEKNVPAGLLVLEKQIIMNRMIRRPDVVVHDRAGRAVMVVECKAPEVKVTQQAFDQIARYNSVVRCPYLVVTNGLQNFCCQMDHENNTYSFLEDIPDYENMLD
jgi:hypothetical protein